MEKLTARNIGIKLELELYNTIKDTHEHIYISQLIDVIDEKTIVIANPIHEAKYMFITAGTQVKIIFMHQTLGLLFL